MQILCKQETLHNYKLMPLLTIHEDLAGFTKVILILTCPEEAHNLMEK